MQPHCVDVTPRGFASTACPEVYDGACRRRGGVCERDHGVVRHARGVGRGGGPGGVLKRPLRASASIENVPIKVIPVKNVSVETEEKYRGWVPNGQGEAGGLGGLGGLQPCEIKVSLTHTVRRQPRGAC